MTVNFDLDISYLVTLAIGAILFLARFFHLEIFHWRRAMAQIPAGFSDAVTAAFTLKIQADESAAELAAEQAAFAKIEADAQAQIAAAQSGLDAAKTKAMADAQALDQGRKQLEALEDAYLTVGGTLPADPTPAPSTQHST